MSTYDLSEEIKQKYKEAAEIWKREHCQTCQKRTREPSSNNPPTGRAGKRSRASSPINPKSPVKEIGTQTRTDNPGKNAGIAPAAQTPKGLRTPGKGSRQGVASPYGEINASSSNKAPACAVTDPMNMAAVQQEVDQIEAEHLDEVEVTMLYIYESQNERKPCGKPLFDAFMGELYRRLGKRDEYGAEQVIIEWADHSLGRGNIASANQETTDWVKQQALAFHYDNKKIRAWTKDEFGTRVVYKGFVHGKRWTKESGTAALISILKNSGWNNAIGKFQIITWQAPTKRNGMFVRFEADNGLEAFLDGKGQKLDARIAVLRLTKKVVGVEAADK